MRSISFLCLLLLYCCGRPSSPQSNSLPTEQVKPQQISESAEPVDPTSGWTEEVKKAWSLFTKDGRYRMAQPDDFRSPGTTGGYKYANRPWIAWWGAFAIIVIDNSRTDRYRYGLILFVEPKDNWKLPSNKKKPLRPVWLYRNRDLSRTSLEQASGYWFVIEYSEDGTRKVCEVDWSERQQKYICR